ncbi:ABC transporter ATP-binding protein [Pseudonocardia ailaonensis]|uniref:ABC transporter ATP-binding protein n=1 Tax=Pseudonocardia ailaonensis TaxID=367279 RepID=A0ABN2MZT0_9PSEU
MLSVENLSVSYGKRQVLHSVSLEVAPDECVAVIGPNGAGKTTLARTLLGIGGAGSGAVRLGGTQILGQRGDQIVRQGLALVPERGGLFTSMTVGENLTVSDEFGGSGGGSALQTCFELFPRLRERLDQRAGTLSGGERRMLLISKALLARPRVVVMDEPSLGLSPLLTTEVILRLVPRLLERGVAVLLIEQNARLALRASRRALILDQGRVRADGTSAEILASESLRTAYVGL